MRERLQKILARAGHGSRRASESLITSGRVRVNGMVVHELGAQADPDVDRIELDGIAVVPEAAAAYIAVNKPPGLVTTARDPQGRATVMRLLHDVPPHTLPIGRLDRDSEGLLLFTNDGEFAHRLAHPRYRVDKEYHALVMGESSADALQVLRTGVQVDGQTTAPADVDVSRAPYGHHAREGHLWLRIVIHEGRRRQVRLMCRAVGLPVRTLVRTRIGGVTLAKMAPGDMRHLSQAEVVGLRELVGLE